MAEKAFAMGSSFAIYWQKHGDRYIAAADYTLPEHLAALRHRRGDDKTFVR